MIANEIHKNVVNAPNFPEMERETSVLAGYVGVLTALWKERAMVTDHIKEARRENPTGVDRLIQERKLIEDDIAKLMKEVKRNGFDPQAIEIVTHEAMETPKQREKRQHFELVLAVYRQDLAKANRN